MKPVSDKFLDNLLKDYSRSIVGRLCKQAEILQDSVAGNLEASNALGLLKSFNRELIYENFREISGQIKAFQRGQQFESLKVYNPSDSKESA